MKFLVMLVLVSFFSIKSLGETKCEISEAERALLIEADYKEFDQSMGNGWRAWADRGCFQLAIDLLDEYFRFHETKLLDWQNTIIIWHSGQMSGFLGDHKTAREKFKKCIRPNEPKNIEILWNDYVYATIAFLDRDLVELKRRRDIIANGPSFDGRKANLNIVDNFLKCPNEAYSIAYSGCGK